MTNKKGIQWVGEETGKIIIALLVIVMLIGLSFILFRLFIKNNEVLQAQKSLDKIQTAGLSIEEGKMRDDVVYESPRDWTMRFYGEKEKTIGCENGKCLCLCKDFECDIKAKYVCKAFGKNVGIISSSRNDYIRFGKVSAGLIVKNIGGGLEVSEKS